ncbi:hypothetical protein NE857_21780 [Nocardiopsis exhalans]|uniref:Plasmid segregation centromere-binding protein ParR n=1 Tax=Nocardiopsis exhalans TaxID=163604 RepID=A0ABY5D430_9ACTN|nr:hypothetical protein [Nocardiopsis exhalans]USY17949.1 hypothetical protein NE857_21780 [Nocardiopsis exhalans]
MVAKKKPEPRRVRLTIPAADESSQTWIDHQDDASASMRMLIRESIQRDGYVDVVNRPVEQLPQVAADDEIDGPDPAETELADDLRHKAEVAGERTERTPPAEEPKQEQVEPAADEEPKTKKSQAPSGLDAFLTGP